MSASYTVHWLRYRFGFHLLFIELIYFVVFHVTMDKSVAASFCV